MKKVMFGILFASALFAGCKNKNPDLPDNAINPDVMNNPASASKGNTKDNVPAYQFAEESHDFGTLTDGEQVSFAFRFKNIGNGDLVIRAAQGSCGCTVPDYPKEPVPPGGTGLINVTFNSEGKTGVQHKTVTVIANTIPNTHVLNIHANVLPKPDNK
jgi:hypothetical protein